MIKLAALSGGAPHAPAFTRNGVVAAFVSGADVLGLPLQLTKDEHVVVFGDETLDGRVTDLSLRELRALDVGARFSESDGARFAYPARVESLDLMLDALPQEVWLLLEFKPAGPTERQRALAQRTAQALAKRGRTGQVVVYGPEAGALEEFRRAAPAGHVACSAGEATSGDPVKSAITAHASAVILSAGQLVDAAGTLTALGSRVAATSERRQLALGAIAVLDPLSEERYQTLARTPGIWAVAVPSLLDAAAVARPGSLLVHEDWKARAAERQDVNAQLWHLGYAKYNPERFCHVYPDGGLHVDIKPYTSPVAHQPSGDPVDDALHDLLERAWSANRDWPFYSGGGAGFAPGIEGDFTAEVDFESGVAQQATTVEMAALNVDPPTHRPPWVKNAAGQQVANSPASFRDKHTFFDPHGAPPYVGVEHDEDDGWRINWNLGTDYDSNQYGRAMGDGRLLTGRVRLDRRGSHFAAYYRRTGKTAASDWICVGTVRNESLNRKVFLRLAGKRWRQEDPTRPDTFMPVIANHFVFRNFTLRGYH